MKNERTVQLCSVLKSLKGKTLTRVEGVDVEIDGEWLELLDSLIVSYASSGEAVQIVADAHHPYSLRLSDSSGFVVIGEYGERTGERLRTISVEPLELTEIYSAWERGRLEDHLIGILLASGDTIAIAINFYLDEAEVMSPEEFWSYLGSLLPRTREIYLAPL